MADSNGRNGMLEFCFACCYDSFADAGYLDIFIVDAGEVPLSKPLDHWRAFTSTLCMVERTSILYMVERGHILVRGQIAGTGSH